jgi:hypothetical protein
VLLVVDYAGVGGENAAVPLCGLSSNLSDDLACVAIVFRHYPELLHGMFVLDPPKVLPCLPPSAAIASCRK